MFFFSSRRRHTRLQGDWSSDVCSSDLLAADGYIFVFQDIRGRGKSQGDYLMNRPLRAPGDTSAGGFDEASDTYDAVEWLIHNVPNNNGRVGGLGISYPRWLATIEGLSGHAALHAGAPQAPMTDTRMGD